MVEETKTEAPQEVDMVTKATLAAERLEKATMVMEGLLKKNQEIEARRILGGQSNITPPAVPVEETPKEYAKRIMGGGK